MGPIDQFKVTSYFSLGGFDFTNSALAMLMTCICVLYFLWILPRVSRSFRILADVYYEFIDGIASRTIGENYEFLLPFISSIFLFILFGNLIGLIPGFFTFTSHVSTNVVLSGTVLLSVICVAAVRHGIKFVKLFCPSGIPIWLIPLLTPIELISFFMRAFSLAIRLCINMCVGHMMLKVFLLLAARFGVFGPAIGLIYVPFLALEFGIAFLQAYIFTILSCVYLKDAVELQH